ncbi:VWA domain-containing protein [Clostridium sp. D43t1_170807_H7]|uniref:vWA domain-containing protein n=1 Tax=Clostridium sp. D43t1_170807_H7 TaxID=2787140 RepID=UPI00189A5229|nr:VWA domain-containing protein [Clostridium sp. D43t1_170807_H7]
MAGELIINSEVNTPYLLADGKEKEIKIQLDIFPSDEVRNTFSGRGFNNNGVDLCLVLDTSESMTYVVNEKDIVRTGRFGYSEGRRIEYVENGISRFKVAIKACEHLINTVRPQDNISLIVYNDNPTVVFKNIAGYNKEIMLNALKTIKVEGNTNISSAIFSARKLLSSNNNDKIKKIIFLTDGVPTCDTEESAIREASYLAYDNISIDCLGIGNGIRYSLLENLAKQTNGRTDIIKKEAQAKEVFERLFENAKDVIINDVKVQIKNVAGNVRITDHYTATPEKKYLGKAKLGLSRSMSLNIGQVEKDQLYRYYLLGSITVPIQRNGYVKVMDVEIQYRIPAIYGNQVFTVTKTIELEFGTMFERSREIVGDVEKGFRGVIVKRLEDELEEYYNTKNHAKVVNTFNEIIRVYTELGNIDLIRKYSKQLDSYNESNKIDMQQLNENRNTSSKADDAGALERDLDTEELFNLI